MTAVYTAPNETVDTSVGDGALGAQVKVDRDRLPTGIVFVFGPAYDGVCFAIKNNRLYHCKAKQPESWPQLQFLEIGPPSLEGKTGLFHNGQAHYLNEAQIWYIQGTASGSFQPFPTNARTGAQSARGAISVAGKGIYHTGPDGIYLFSSGNDVKVTEDTLEPLFRGETVNGMPGVADMSTSWLFEYESRLYFGYADTVGGYPDNLLILNINTNQSKYYEYGGAEFRSITKDEENDRLIVGGQDGYVRVIEDPSLDDDDGTAISWEVQSKDFTHPLRAHFPRWCKYDVDASAASGVTGELLLNGAVHQTHTITGSRLTRRRLVEDGNGDRASLRISGSGPATVYAAEFE